MKTLTYPNEHWNANDGPNDALKLINLSPMIDHVKPRPVRAQHSLCNLHKEHAVYYSKCLERVSRSQCLKMNLPSRRMMSLSSAFRRS